MASQPEQKQQPLSTGDTRSSHESSADPQQPPATDEAGMPWPRGYHRLAAFMGKSRQVSIFRRFGKLTMFNLLSLQAELVELERDFQDIRMEDDSSGDGARENLSLSFQTLRESKDTPNDYQWKKFEEIGPKLEKYHKALLRAADLYRLDTAPEERLSTLRDWISGEDQGKDFLGGEERVTWKHASDLVTLYDYKGLQDPAPTWVTRVAKEWIPSLLSSGNRREGQVDLETGATFYQIERSRVNQFSTIIATVISSILPLLAIMVLYFVKSTIKRLGISIAFTALFAIALLCFGARRIEIFAGTASFAAIEVVFIGTVSYSAT